MPRLNPIAAALSRGLERELVLAGIVEGAQVIAHGGFDLANLTTAPAGSRQTERSSMQRTVLVLSFDLDDDPEQLAEMVAAVTKRLDPPTLPGFGGQMRVAVEPVSRQVETWLDDGQPPAPDRRPTIGRPPRPNARNRAQRRHPLG